MSHNLVKTAASAIRSIIVLVGRLRSAALRVMECAVLAISLWAAASVCSAVTYPYALSNNMRATLNVNLGSKTNFNNRLIMLNCDWTGQGYTRGFYNPSATNLISTFKPSGLRWPCGVWANFYDYTNDNVAVYDGYKDTYYNTITNWASNSNMVFGFPSLATLHSNLQFDVLSTWNINYDGTDKSVARLQYQEASGIDTKWIELGNENFYKSQCSLAVNNVQSYINITRAQATALRAVKPGVQLSVPVQWKPNVINKSWNQTLAANNDYYDAVTVHVYITPDTNGEAEVLGARNGLLAAVQPVARMFPNKPIWLSEWASECGGNAISVLGITDEYLGIFDHPELFEQASFFQMNGRFLPLFVWNAGPETTTKTSCGAAYEVMRNVFENSQVFASTIVSDTITTGQNAVNAAAVIKNDQVVIFAINKTTNSIPLNLNFNGHAYTNSFVHQAFVFTNINDYSINYSLTANVLVSIAPVNGGILLPPLSLNQISGLSLPAQWRLIANAGTNQMVVATNLSGSAAVTLDGTGSTSENGTITNYVWTEGGTTLATGASPTVMLNLGTHTIILTVGDTTGATNSDTVVITVWPPGTVIASVTNNTPGTLAWTCPSGVTNVQVECWGGGGAGGSAKLSATSGGAGGGGAAAGAYARQMNVPVTPGSNYNLTIPAAATCSAGFTNGQRFNGSAVTFSGDGGVTVTAAGGQGGASHIGKTQGAVGTGSTNGCVGEQFYKGGSGGNVSNNNGGNGGGGPSDLADGGDGSTITYGGGGGVGATGSDAAHNGGDGGSGRGGQSLGYPGNAPGGGGGGGKSQTTNAEWLGGTGGLGQIILTSVQLPAVEQPMLGHSLSGGSFRLSWSGTGFKVQFRTNLTSGTWTDVPGGTNSPLTVTPSLPEAFYRLTGQ